jgi:hypothetical protein
MTETRSVPAADANRGRPVGADCWTIVAHENPTFQAGPLRVLNAGDREASIEVSVYFADREPTGPYHLVIPPRRLGQFSFNELAEPDVGPNSGDHAAVIVSDVPIVIQGSGWHAAGHAEKG